MGTGAITGYIDVAQLTLYAFWIFFAGLIYYLQRESKREGFPMESDLPSGRTISSPGVVGMPSPKTYLSAHGGAPVMAPSGKVSPQTLRAQPSHRWIGAPLVPTGNPMHDGVGPGSWADRADVPDVTIDGDAKIVPLRAAPGFNVSGHDADPRGLPVVGDDGVVGGTVREVWVDRSEMMVRYLEVEVPNAARGPHVLLPLGFARIGREQITVKSILGHQFADVPRLKHPDRVTLLEEERVVAYYGGGTLYAEPSRQEPLV